MLTQTSSFPRAGHPCLKRKNTCLLPLHLHTHPRLSHAPPTSSFTQTCNLLYIFEGTFFQRQDFFNPSFFHSFILECQQSKRSRFLDDISVPISYIFPFLHAFLSQPRVLLDFTPYNFHSYFYILNFTFA